MAELLDQFLAARPAWHRDAACKEHGELAWFSELGEHPSAAQAICARCLVCEPCLEAGMGEAHGIWAGAGWRERRRLRVARGELAVGVDRVA